MTKVLSVEETKQTILNYIRDDRKIQAVLLDGDWGGGKTFFLKEYLIPALEKEKIKCFKISLYGMSDVNVIQEMIYANWIEKYMTNSMGSRFTKVTSLFGKTAVSIIENKIGKIGTENILKDLSEKVVDEKYCAYLHFPYYKDFIIELFLEFQEKLEGLNNQTQALNDKMQLLMEQVIKILFIQKY